MIGWTVSGSFAATHAFLKRLMEADIFRSLDRYGQMGVDALSSATPVDTGRTAGSWSYYVQIGGDAYSIVWYNTNIVAGRPLAIMLQYGHGTGTGGYVAGRDYINPAIQPVFDKIADDVWKEVMAA